MSALRNALFRTASVRKARGWVRLVTTRGHPVERYQEEFPKGASAFLDFLRRCRIAQPADTGEPIGVVVMPWVSTPAPWFTIALALGLARRGKRIELIWDDSGLGLPMETSERVRLQNVHIARALDVLGDVFPITRLTGQRPQPSRDGDQRALEVLSELNLIWGMRGARASQEERDAFRLAPAALVRTLALVRGLLRESRYPSLLVIGGIYGTSGLVRLAAEEAGIRLATFDGTFGVVQISVDGIAAQQSDIPLAFRELERSPSEVLDRARGLAKEAFQRRVEARDEAEYQLAPPQADGRVPSPGVVIPMNVEWDGAALGRHVIFANTADWLMETVGFVLSESPEEIVVRQHPAERRRFERSGFDVGKLLSDHFGTNPRVRLVAADEPVNTYDLIRSAAVILPFASTIGIEAAAMGKHVLVSGESCYSDLGFVWTASSRDEYLRLLGRSLDGELPLKPDQVKRAWLCYYLTPFCNRVWTDFNPAPSRSDFWTWVARDPEELFADSAVGDMLMALEDGRPLSLIRHERIVLEHFASIPASGDRVP